MIYLVIVLFILLFVNAFINRSFIEQIEDLKKSHHIEREAWAEERKDLYNRIMSQNLSDYNNNQGKRSKSKGSNNFLKTSMEQSSKQLMEGSLELE